MHRHHENGAFFFPIGFPMTIAQCLTCSRHTISISSVNGLIEDSDKKVYSCPHRLQSPRLGSENHIMERDRLIVLCILSIVQTSNVMGYYSLWPAQAMYGYHHKEATG